MDYEPSTKYQSPSWQLVRWIVMIPASIIAAGIIRPIFSFIYRSSIDAEPGRGKVIMFFLAELLASGLMGAALVGIATMIAPRGKNKVALIWGSICVLVCVILAINFFAVGDKGTAFSIVAAGLGAIYILVQAVWGDLFEEEMDL